jgi:hypothetical protein
MPLEDKERCVSPKWKLDTLKLATSRAHAAAYLEDFWGGWIAEPMLSPGNHGGWAQLTLACLAVEATAQFYKPFSKWQGLQWSGPDRPVSLEDKKAKHPSLTSTAAFCFMFELIFKGQEPSTIPAHHLSLISYRVFRCGLAHRGLSQDLSTTSLKTNWLGVIDGQGIVFRDLSDAGKKVLSVDPPGFAKCVADWFSENITKALRAGGNVDVDEAFKDWCKTRWDATNWKF